jgi:hypothetical protein
VLLALVDQGLIFKGRVGIVENAVSLGGNHQIPIGKLWTNSQEYCRVGAVLKTFLV